MCNAALDFFCGVELTFMPFVIEKMPVDSKTITQLLLLLIIIAVVISVFYWKIHFFVGSNWKNFWASIIAFVVIPLMPLIFEALLKGNISLGSSSIACSVFAASVASTTKNDFILYVGILISIIMTFVFASSLTNAGAMDESWTNFTFLCFVVIHIAERYQIHVLESRPVKG